MNSQVTLSPPSQLPAEVQAVLNTAQRVETPCGAGTLVWHIWGTASCVKGLPPVVLFHGGSGSWTHWLRNIGVLVESGRRVLVPDMPGFGDSAGPAQGEDADACPEAIEHGLNILVGDAACDLVGFSFGGMVAGFLATQFPARPNRLVLVGAPGLGVQPKKALRLNAWRHLPHAEQRDAVHRKNLAALMLHRSSSITELVVRLHVANVLRDRMQQRRLARSDALALALVQIQCPLYAIYGREDVLFQEQMEALETALQQAGNFHGLTVIEASGHWVQFEGADAFNEALLGVLDAELQPVE